MKVICNREELQKGLAVAFNAVTTRTPKPVLQCVRMTATPSDGLTLQATDLEVSVRYRLGMVEVNTPGETLVPADRIRQITSNSIDQTLTLEGQANSLVIRGSDAIFTLNSSPPEDFPPTTDFSDEPGVSLPAGQLRDLIRKVEYAAAKENTRYAISGVRAELGGKEIRMIATDGRRLAKAWAHIEDLDAESGAIIPLRAMSLLRSVLTDPEEPVTIRLLENQAVFQTRNAVVATQLVEGLFPRYEDVIPRDNDRKISFNTTELLSAVKRAALLTNEESRGVKMSFSRNSLVLSSSVPESGQAEIRLTCDYDGPNIDIGFNPDFVQEALRVVDIETIQLELKDANKPGIIKAGTGFVYVVMPVNLNSQSGS